MSHIFRLTSFSSICREDECDFRSRSPRSRANFSLDFVTSFCPDSPLACTCTRRTRNTRNAPGTYQGRCNNSTILCLFHSHSMALVLSSRHSSCTQFSASTRNACRRMTRCRVSSASGTKVGTTSKTFFKLRALIFCFCPKGASGRDSGARLGGIARF